MVLVPDLSGLSSSAAIAALTSSGLDYSLGADVDTSTSSLDNLVAEQSPSANTLVDYSTVVAFRLYNFVAAPSPTPPSPGCVPNYLDDCFGPRGEVGQIGCDGNCVYTPLPTPTPTPPSPTPTPCPPCSGPPPFPECSCVCGTYMC